MTERPENRGANVAAGIPPATLKAWSSIPRALRSAVRGLDSRGLRRRGGSEGRSIREYVHHLVEANLVASTIVVAALGKPGCTYDWSWLYPDERWMQRLGYDRAPLEPALALLEALCTHVAGLLRNAPKGRNPRVRLRGSAEARPRGKTVGQVLVAECEHARHHLRDIAAAKGGRRRARPRGASG
jgi:DinB family protein